MAKSLLSPTELAALPGEARLNRREVEALYRINGGTLRNRDAAGLGPRRTATGREVMYAKADVEAWLAAHSK